MRKAFLLCNCRPGILFRACGFRDLAPQKLPAKANRTLTQRLLRAKPEAPSCCHFWVGILMSCMFLEISALKALHERP